MAQNTYLFVEEVTPEVVADAQQRGISAVHKGVPPFYRERAEAESWVLPHTITVDVPEPPVDQVDLDESTDVI